MSGEPVSALGRPAAVLTDIEGTTSPIAFVHQVLFPYARARLPALVAGGGPEVEAALAEVARRAPGEDPLAALLGWMDRDAKEAPLKELQGIAWREGYRAGELRGEVYPDVAPCLRAWQAAGVRLMVYSSGSVEAQRLIFGHSTAGDLAPLFDGFFDTRTGPKREAASYRVIAADAGLPSGAMLFLSDVGAELNAASEAGMRTCQLVRAEDGTQPAAGHRQARDFPEAARLFGLPA